MTATAVEMLRGLRRKAMRGITVLIREEAGLMLFTEVHPTLDNYWRAIILFGRNGPQCVAAD
jgi:hypothetical protein